MIDCCMIDDVGFFFVRGKEKSFTYKSGMRENGRQGVRVWVCGWVWCECETGKEKGKKWKCRIS